MGIFQLAGKAALRHDRCVRTPCGVGILYLKNRVCVHQHFGGEMSFETSSHGKTAKLRATHARPL